MSTFAIQGYRGQALHRYTVASFAGGLDVRTTPRKLANEKQTDRLTRADNVNLTTDGGVTKRAGLVAINASTLGASVVILGGVQYRQSDGDVYNVVGTGDGRVVRINTDGTTANLATGKSVTTGVRYRFAVYNDLLIITNGYDAPMSWDGTTFQNLAGSPPATGQVVVTHANRVFMTARAAPSTLYWSKLNNEDDWTGTDDAGFMDVALQDNSTIVDLISANQELIILKGSRPYRLQGIGPTTGYNVADHLLPATGSVGGVSSQGACFAVNDVWYLSHLGLHRLAITQQFGDLKESFVSVNIEPYFRRGTTRQISLNQLNKAVVAYDNGANRILVAVDTNNDGVNDTTLAYDIEHEAWTVWPTTAYASLWPKINQTTGARRLWAGGYDGFVYATDRSDSTDAIDAAASHTTTLGLPGIEKSPRYAYLYFSHESAGSVRVTFSYDFGLASGGTYVLGLQAPSASWGSGAWGEGVWGQGTQVAHRLDLHGHAEAVTVTVRNISATQPFTWLGYDVFFREKRAIRQPRSA